MAENAARSLEEWNGEKYWADVIYDAHAPLLARLSATEQRAEAAERERDAMREAGNVLREVAGDFPDHEPDCNHYHGGPRCFCEAPYGRVSVNLREQAKAAWDGLTLPALPSAEGTARKDEDLEAAARIAESAERDAASILASVRENLLAEVNRSPVHARDDHSQNCLACSLLRIIDAERAAAPEEP